MKEDIEIIEYIYQNCRLEEDSIARIIKFRKKDDNLKNILGNILNEYKKIELCSKNMLKRRNIEPRKISIFSKIISDIDIKRNLANGDYTKLLDMIVNSSKILIIQINSKLDENNVKRKSVINLLERFEKLQLSIINILKE